MKLALIDPTCLYAIVPCDHCRAEGFCGHGAGNDPDWCCKCGGHGEEWIDITWLYNLARALAIGGALCASYEAGWKRSAHMLSGVPISRQPRTWEPGVGREFCIEERR